MKGSSRRCCWQLPTQNGVLLSTDRSEQELERERESAGVIRGQMREEKEWRVVM